MNCMAYTYFITLMCSQMHIYLIASSIVIITKYNVFALYRKYISYMNIASYSYMCELHTQLPSQLQEATNAVCLRCPSISVTIPPRKVLHAQIIKLKVLLVVRRIVSWQILRIDKCVRVVNLFYTRGLMPHMFFAFAHVCAV